MTEPTTARKQKAVRLNPGVTRGQLRAFYAAGFMAASLMVYVSLSKDFLLNTYLKIPPSEQGQVAGLLQSFREVFVLFSIWLGGILADRLSRRFVFVAGFAALGVSYLLFPLAGSIGQLLFFYAINAVGAAFITAMLSTLLADYVVNEDRGKAGGVQGMFSALSGLLLMNLLIGLPALLRRSFGLDVQTAGRISYTVIAGLCLLTAVFLWFTMHKGALAAVEKRGFLQLLREGVGAARLPGVALAYAAAFVSRGDLVVVGTFLKIWISKAATAQGMDAASASARGIPLLLASALAMLIAAPLIGRLTDRVSRVTALAIAAVIAAVVYTLTIFVIDPLGKGLVVVMALIGVAQIAGIITSQVLIAQYAPEAIRGSVVGVFGFCGALAQIALTLIGGRLFDQWTEAAPFVLVGALNLVLCIVALALRQRLAAPEAGRTATAAQF